MDTRSQERRDDSAASSGPGLKPARAVDAAGLDTGLTRSPVRPAPEMVAATFAGVAASAVLVSGIAVMATL